MRAVGIARAASEEVRRGHPWVWRSAVKKGLEQARPGEVVELQTLEGASLGCGIADPESIIAVRVWMTNETPGGRGRLDEGLIDARLARALALRERMFRDGGTTAYRLLHGEGDRMPGFVVDRYGAVAVLRLDGGGAEAFAEMVVPRLWKALAQVGVKTLVRREQGERSGKSGAAKTALLH